VARPKKIHHFKITPFKNAAGTKSWRVTGTKPNGERVRKNFADKSEAIQSMADLEAEITGRVEESKTKRTRLSTEELAAAEAAVLAADGRDISEIVTHYLSLESRARSKNINLNAALLFVESHYRAEIQTASVLTAYNKFVEDGAGWSPKTREHYESSLKLLLKPDPNKPVHDFTLSDIERILKLYKNLNSQRTYRRAFKTFFNWCAKHHYCLENPCDRLNKLPRDMSQIAALSLDECKRLLYAAILMEDKATAACVAVGLFAGLRPSEINDLKAEDILKDKIRVSGGKLRRKLNRSTPIPPVLAEWLKEFPFTGLPTGWSSKHKRLKKATKAKKWVQDIIRHTSITFQTERDQDEARTAFNNGTSIQMMNRHYRDSIDDDKTVAEFWSLTPAKLRAKPPKVDLELKRRVNWPEKKALAKLVWEKPLSHAAKDIGVSDVGLKKRCTSLGIELPRQGHWLRQ
jgi:integrase